jgi:transposase
MPRRGEYTSNRNKNKKKLTQKEVDGFVKRYMDGEPVDGLAKEAGRARASFYLWVKKYKEELLEKSDRTGMSEKELEKSDKSKLIAQVQALKLENAKLRNKLVSLMIKAGEL